MKEKRKKSLPKRKERLYFRLVTDGLIQMEKDEELSN